MKKFNIKSGLCGFMAGILAACAIPAVAKDIQTTIDVAYKNIKIYADGNLVNTNGDNEAFIYNGTTYLPVRAVGEAFNKAVEWDGSTSSVYIGTKPFISTQPTILLEDLDYFTKTAYIGELDSEGWIKDNTGFTHSSGFLTEGGEIQYLLNGKYKTFTGTVGIPYICRDDNDSSIIKIYGDDKLLYTSPVLKAGVKPANFNINVTGVLNLKIEIDGYSIFSCIYDAGFYA